MSNARCTGGRPQSAPRARHQFGFAVALAIAVPACTAAPAGDPSPGEEDPISAPANPIFPAGCATATPHQTLTVGGKFKVTDRSYTKTGCADAYIVDVNNKGNAPFTNIAWDEAVPTTAAACTNAKLRIGLWDRTGATPVSLGERVSNGIWFEAPDGSTRCRTPRLLLQQEYPTFNPNSTRDWRLVVRSQQDAGSSITKKRFAYADVDHVARQAVESDNFLNNLRAANLQGTVEPRVARIWARDFNSLAPQCRAAELELALMKFGAASFTKAGAVSADVTARNTTYRNLLNSLCVLGATDLEFQNNLLGHLDATIKVRDAIGTQYASQASTIGMGQNQLAMELMDQLQELDLGRIAENCEPDIEGMFTFMTSGTLPSGMTAERLLFGDCTNPGEGPSQAATRLGVGGGLSAANVRSRLKDCMAPLINGAATNVCNDPRASGAANEGVEEDNAPPVDEGEDVCYDADNGFAVTDCSGNDPETPTVNVLVTNSAGEAVKVDVEVIVINGNSTANRAEIQVAIQIKADDSGNQASSIAEVVIDVLDDLGLPGVNTLRNFIKFAAKHDEFIPGIACLQNAEVMGPDPACLRAFQPQPRPTPNSGLNPNRYCAPDFAPGGWYGAYDRTLTTDAPARELNDDDRLDHCLCAVMEPKYTGGAGLPGIAPSGMCPTAAEKRAQDCLTPGADDGPKPGCTADLLPGQIDEDEWNRRICNAIQCPSNKQRSENDDGACACIDKPDVIGSPTNGCAISQVALCTEDNPGPCLCMPIDYGILPFGNEPDCRLDGTRFPGTLEGWLFSNPAEAVVGTIGGERFLMLDPGASGQSSAVSPTLFKSNFTNLGTTIRPRTIISKAVTSGQNVDLQLYCTNLENNLIHGAMGQCRLNAQTAEQPGSCEITLNSSLRNACFNGGGFTLEWNVQAPIAYNGYVGFGKFDFGGTLTPTPASQLAPLCPTPPPALFGPRPLPVWEDLGGRPGDLFQDYLLGNGAEVPAFSTVYLAR